MTPTPSSDPRRPRVAFVCDWFFYYTAGLIRGLSRSVPVDLITRDHGFELGVDGDASEIKRAMLPPGVGFGLVRGPQRNPLSVLSAAHAAQRLREFAPDVLHVQDNADWRLEHVVRRASAPFVLTLHDIVPHLGSPDWRKNAIQRLVSERFRRDAAAFVVHGTALEDQLRRQEWYAGQDVHVVPLGVLGHSTGHAPLPDTPTLLFFGRLERYKGLDVFLEACSIASRRVAGLRAIIAGTGSEAEPMRERFAGNESLDWRVGFVRDTEIAGLFAEASAVVLPYREASQSGVVPLAFANGRPVIATRVGGLGEAVEHGETGLLVDKPDPRDVADAIVTLFADRERLERMAEQALAVTTAGELSPGVIAQRHLEVYASVLRERQGGRHVA